MLAQLNSQRRGSASRASGRSSSQAESDDDGTESVTSSGRHGYSKRVSDSSATSVDEWELYTKKSREGPKKHIEQAVSKQVSEVIASAARKRRIIFEVVVVGGIRVTGLSRPSWSTQGEDGRMSSLIERGTCGFIFLIAMLVVGRCWTFMCAIGSYTIGRKSSRK